VSLFDNNKENFIFDYFNYNEIKHLSFNNDNSLLLSVNSTKNITVWNLKTYYKIMIKDAHKYEI
jgi:WD40 repeat protein